MRKRGDDGYDSEEDSPFIRPSIKPRLRKNPGPVLKPANPITKPISPVIRNKRKRDEVRMSAAEKNRLYKDFVSPENKKNITSKMSESESILSEVSEEGSEMVVVKKRPGRPRLHEKKEPASASEYKEGLFRIHKVTGELVRFKPGRPAGFAGSASSNRKTKPKATSTKLFNYIKSIDENIRIKKDTRALLKTLVIDKEFDENQAYAYANALVLSADNNDRNVIMVRDVDTVNSILRLSGIISENAAGPTQRPTTKVREIDEVKRNYRIIMLHGSKLLKAYNGDDINKLNKKGKPLYAKTIETVRKAIKYYGDNRMSFRQYKDENIKKLEEVIYNLNPVMNE